VRPPNPELVEKILTVTTDMVAERGPRSVTLRAIAKEVGVTATTIVYYFQDKKGLFDAAKMNAVKQLDEAVAAAETATDDSTEQLRALIDALAGWSTAHPHAFSLVFDSLPPSPEVVDDAVVGFDAIARRLQGVLERGRAAGELSAEAPEELATMCFAAVVGIVDLFLNERLPRPFQDDPTPVIERFTTVFLESLVPARETAPTSGRSDSHGDSGGGTAALPHLRRASRPLDDDEIESLAAAGGHDAGKLRDGPDAYG